MIRSRHHILGNLPHSVQTINKYFQCYSTSDKRHKRTTQRNHSLHFINRYKITSRSAVKLRTYNLVTTYSCITPQITNKITLISIIYRLIFVVFVIYLLSSHALDQISYTRCIKSCRFMPCFVCHILSQGSTKRVACKCTS